jgi:putative pre-16S rRNA nuclease
VKALGIDYGTKRIGLAVSDALGIAAYALSTITHRSDEETLRTISTIVEEREVDIIVIGLPLNMDGTEGPQSATTRVFGAKLEPIGKPIEFVDERLTTDRAHTIMRDAGVKHAKRKKQIDRVAAKLILESWLQLQG